jgi:hypothetical protein
MRFPIILCLILCVLFGMYVVSYAERGFSIEGGLLYDNPLGDSHRPYKDMEGGFGYIANIAYDFFDRGGLELGVMHSSHNYTLAVVNNAISQADASKSTFYLKARIYLFKQDKSEVIFGLGGGLTDISGSTVISNFIVSDDFSGACLLASLDYRYTISPGLALSAYLGLNLADYTRYELMGSKQDYPGSMPNGNSLCWGITVFHRIGIPQ